MCGLRAPTTSVEMTSSATSLTVTTYRLVSGLMMRSSFSQRTMMGFSP